MLRIGDGVDVSELPGSLADGADVLRRFTLGQQAVLLDQDHIDEAYGGREEKCQLVGAVCAALIQRFQHAVVGKGAGGVKQAVGHGQRKGKEALGVLAVALGLAGCAQRGVLRGVHHAEANGADAHENDGADGKRGIVLAAKEQQRHHGDERAGRVADRRGNRQLNVPQPQIPERHRANVQQGNGEVCPDDSHTDLRAADEYFERGVQTHHNAHGDDHFEVSEVIVLTLTADLGEEVAPAPAEQGGKRKPEPHIELLNSFVLLIFDFGRNNSTRRRTAAEMPVCQRRSANEHGEKPSGKEMRLRAA